MEDLFSTNLDINNQNIVYRVIFADGEYTFLSDSDQSAFKSFSFRRENDTWLDQDMLPPQVKQQAEEALERYLLKQH